MRVIKSRALSGQNGERIRDDFVLRVGTPGHTKQDVRIDETRLNRLSRRPDRNSRE